MAASYIDASNGLVRVPGSHGNHPRWIEACPECGRERLVDRKLLGHRCRACSNRLRTVRKRRADGLARSKLDVVWTGMMLRCGHYAGASPTQLRNYANRGITVCEEWRRDKGLFFQWALANGYAEGLQIDREKNHLGYFPGNCRFVTATVNARNKRNIVLDETKVAEIRRLLLDGVRQREIAHRFGVSPGTISAVNQRRIWVEIEPAPAVSGNKL